MTEERLPLAELLQKAVERDFLRAVAEVVLQILMEADVEGLIRAAHERSPGKTVQSRSCCKATLVVYGPYRAVSLICMSSRLVFRSVVVMTLGWCVDQLLLSHEYARHIGVQGGKTTGKVEPRHGGGYFISILH